MPLTRLPPELLLTILTYLSPPDLLSLSLTSKHIHTPVFNHLYTSHITFYKNTRQSQCPALLWAAYTGSERTALTCLTHGADPNLHGDSRDPRTRQLCPGTALNETPLLVAARMENRDVVRLLLRWGGVDLDVNATDEEGRTAVFWACHFGDEGVLGELLQWQGTTALDSTAPDSEGSGKGTMVDVNIKSKNGGDALYTSCYGGHDGIVKMLLDVPGDREGGRAVDVNAQWGDGNYRALTAAAQEGYEEIVRMLVDAGANVNAPSEYEDGYQDGSRGGNGSALHWAAAHGHVEVMRILLDAGAEVNSRAEHPGPAELLQVAASGGDVDVIQMILDQGVDVNILGHLRGSALCAAAGAGNSGMVKFLLDHGAEVEMRDGRYHSALYTAAIEDHEDVIGVLLDYGADIDAQGGQYGTALQAATVMAHEDTIRVLLERGVGVNVQGGEYGNALRAAVCEGQIEILEMLLDGGADGNAPAGDHGTALQTALEKADEDVLEEFRRRGLIEDS